MSINLEKIVSDVVSERAHQIMTGFNTARDDQHTVNDWIAFIVYYAGRAGYETTPDQERQRFIQVAALAIAALEAFDRNEGFPARQYD